MGCTHWLQKGCGKCLDRTCSVASMVQWCVHAGSRLGAGECSPCWCSPAPASKLGSAAAACALQLSTGHHHLLSQFQQGSEGVAFRWPAVPAGCGECDLMAPTCASIPRESLHCPLPLQVMPSDQQMKLPHI